MKKELLMGNQAIALGALDAGVKFVCGYPGTPSIEIIETVYINKMSDTYVEWSVNEKVALEIASGASSTAMTGGQPTPETGVDAVVCSAQHDSKVAKDILGGNKKICHRSRNSN